MIDTEALPKNRLARVSLLTAGHRLEEPSFRGPCHQRSSALHLIPPLAETPERPRP
jgi:hypothetical protein